jgi:hypothetical protein
MKHLDQKTFCSSTVVGRQSLKQLELVGPFSSAMEREFTSNSKIYLESTGAEVNSICNMRSWLVLMTIHGSILHGGTFSLCRITNTHSVRSGNSLELDTFTDRYAKFMQRLNPVTLGTNEAFYAFSDHLPSNTRHYSHTTAKLQDLRIITRKKSPKTLDSIRQRT